MVEEEMVAVGEKSPTLSSILSSQTALPLGESKRLQVRLKELEQEKRKIEHDLRITRIDLEKCRVDSEALRKRLDELPRTHNKQLQVSLFPCSFVSFLGS
jgi:septal ring factor EnvC (AmiA/AmiB activator)